MFLDASLQLLLKSGVDSSIKIDGKEYCPTKQGVNMVTINFLDFKISKGRAFSLSSSLAAVNLLAELKKHRKSELVILTTQGDMSEFFEGMHCLAKLVIFFMYMVLQVQLIKDTLCLLA